MGREAEIWMDGKRIGETVLTDEEANHFDNAPSVAAKCALSDMEIRKMGINGNDYIMVCVNS